MVIREEVGYDGTITLLSTEYWSNIDEGLETATGIFRIYENDGVNTVSGSNINGEYYGSQKPKTLLYQSDPISIKSGYNSININDILLVVPDKITWTFSADTSDDVLVGFLF